MFKNIKRLVSAAVLTASPLLVLLTPGIAHAAADTCTWTGAGDGTTFSDASNWTGCDNGDVPEAGDTLSFGTIATTTNNLTNDLGVDFAGVTTTDDGSGAQTSYNIDTLSFADGATYSDTSANTSLNIATVTGTGDLTVVGSFGAFSDPSTVNVTGNLTVGTGVSGDTTGALGYFTYGSLTVMNGSMVGFETATSTPATLANAITLGGGSGSGTPTLNFYNNNGAATTWNITAPITLMSDASVELSSDTTANFTGAFSGTGKALTNSQYSATSGTLKIAPSSNTSATVAGTFTGEGQGGGKGVDTAGSGSGTSAPKTPDTGFALLTASPVATLGIVTVLAGGIAYFGHRLQLATAKTSHRR